MGIKDKIIGKKSPPIMDVLNKTLQLEYSLIIHYPRLASTIEDEKTRELVLRLGSDSIKHADVVASAILKLGGDPVWSFDPFPAGSDIVKIFQAQLEKEKLALQLHQQSMGLVRDNLLREKFGELAKTEEWHIQIVEDILSRLG